MPSLATLEAKLIVAAIALAALLALYGTWHHHVYEDGVTHQKAIDDGENAKADKIAKDKLDASNAQVASLQAKLDAKQLELTTPPQEFQNAKITTAVAAADLRSGTKRMSARVTPVASKPARHDQGSTPTLVDHGAEITADLDPTLASDITDDYATGDSAIRRLNACIDLYAAVKAAADGLAQPVK